MDSQAVTMDTQTVTSQISISNTMTLDASQINGNSIIAIDNDGNRIPIIIAPSETKETDGNKNDDESVPVVFVDNSDGKQGEVTENEFEAIVVEQSSEQDLANIQFNVYKTDNNSLVIQIPNDSVGETHIEEQVIEESVQTGTIEDIKVATVTTTCECDICGEYFTNLKDHLTHHPDIETLYSCDTCGKLFSSSDRLTIHLNIHAGNIEDDEEDEPQKENTNNKVGNFKCDVCDKTFMMAKYLQAHKSVHSEEKRFQCSMCDKKFSQKRYVKAHELLHKGIKPFSCNKCSKRFTNVTALKAHMNAHLGLKPFKCTLCSKAFYRQSNLSAHTKRHLKQPFKVENDNKFRCECNLSFMNEAELQAHVGMHTGPEPFKCTYCTMEFRLLCKLQDHAKIHMGSERSYECQICGRAYRHKNSLRSHLASHAQEKLWKCSICDKRFSLQGNLRTHEKLHTGLKPHKCDICGKCFARIDHMRQHRKVHEGIRPYKCEICNKAFTRSHHYQAHLNNIHNETKPHECQVCHKRFGYISNLRTHEKIHWANRDHNKVFNKCRACGQTIVFIKTETAFLQKKEFKCETCGELFHCAQSLTIHQNHHKGDIPYRCNFCTKQFTNNKNLNKHLKIHSGARAYNCHICSKTFIFNHHLKRHLMTHNITPVKKEKMEKDVEEVFKIVLNDDEGDGQSNAEDESNSKGESNNDLMEAESDVLKENSVEDDHNKTDANKDEGKNTEISKTEFTDVIYLKPKTKAKDAINDVNANSSKSKKVQKVVKKSENSKKVVTEPENSKSSQAVKKRKDSDKKKVNVSDKKKVNVKTESSIKNSTSCDTCGKNFDTVSNVKRHKYAVHVKGASSTKSVKEDTRKQAKKQSKSGEPAKKKLFKKDEKEDDEGSVSDAIEPPEGEGSHVCHICDKKFSCLGYLMQHLAKHAGDKPFQCDVCGKGFAMATYLRKHRASHTSTIGTQATPPGSPDKNSNSRTSSLHKKSDSSVTPTYTVRTRKRKLSSSDSDTGDAILKQESSVSKSLTSPSDSNKLEGDICGLKVPTSRYLKQHLKKHEKESTEEGTPTHKMELKTPKSNKKENIKSKALNTGQQTKSYDESPRKEEERRTRSKSVKVEPDSQKVTYTSSGNQPFKCETCGRQFHLPYNFMIHQRMHEREEEEKRFKCDICGGLFTRAYNLKKHKEIHQKPKEAENKHSPIKSVSKNKNDVQKAPVISSVKLEVISLEEKGHLDSVSKCEKCGKQFANAASLKAHQAHHVTKMFKCDVCSKTFTVEGNFLLHKAYHEKAEILRKHSLKTLQSEMSKRRRNRKLNKCGVCGKEFHLAYNLKVHLGTHVKDKPQEYNLIKHQGTHSKMKKKAADNNKDKVSTSKVFPKPIVTLKYRTCHICGMKFYNVFHYKRHLSIHAKYKKGSSNTNNSSVDVSEKKGTSETSVAVMHSKENTVNKAPKTPEVSAQNKTKKVFQSPKSESKSYECHICKKQLSRQYNLKRHLEQVHKEVVSSEELSESAKETGDNVENMEVDEPGIVNQSNEGNEPESLSQPSEESDKEESCIMVVKHDNSGKNESVKSIEEFSAQGIDIPEGSVITVMEDDTGEELFKVQLNDLCTETSEPDEKSCQVSGDASTETTDPEMNSKSPHKSKSKQSLESKPDAEKSDSNTSPVIMNPEEKLVDDSVKSSELDNFQENLTEVSVKSLDPKTQNDTAAVASAEMEDTDTSVPKCPDDPVVPSPSQKDQPHLGFHDYVN